MTSIDPALPDFLTDYAERRFYPRGTRLFNQGDKPEGCYIVVQGQVNTHHYDADIQTEAGLQPYTPGEVVGAVGTIDQSIRTISASADTDVEALFLSNQQMERMRVQCLQSYQQFIDLRANTLARKFRALHERACSLAVAESKSPIVDDCVARANAAQRQFADWSENKVGSLLGDIAERVNQQAESLAEQTVHETGMGVIAHKVIKIRMGTLDVAYSLQQHPDSPVQLEAPGVETMAMPIGVVFGMIPVTNPVETIVFKVLSCLKARNAIIISSHRKARPVGDRTVAIIREVLAHHGAPVDLVQTPVLPANRKLTQAFMTHPDVHFILATGGPSMVHSAYKSGTPAIGVGKGNAPVWVDADADPGQVANHVINSKAFDNGVVCGSENNLLVDANIYDAFIATAVAERAALLTDDECQRLLEKAFCNGVLNPEWIGQSAAVICAGVGIARDYPIKLILAEVATGDLDSPLVREKLAPILSLIRVHTEEEAISHAKGILNTEGRGHTAIIHSHDPSRIRRYSSAVDVSRVLVNSPGTQGCIGACNGLQLSWTLGCGTQGGGSTSDNVTYRHLQNTKRIAYAC